MIHTVLGIKATDLEDLRNIYIMIKLNFSSIGKMEYVLYVNCQYIQ